MTEIQVTSMRAYRIRVEFFSDGDSFAVDTFTIDLPDGQDPMTAAEGLADESIYFDERVPYLSRTIEIEPLDSDDPDPPPASGGAARPVCPNCGSDDIVRDATARWDQDGQCWSLSGTFDFETCDTCGADGDDMAVWATQDSMSPPDRFMWNVSGELQNASLVRDACFQLFCVNSFDRITVEQAAADWRSRKEPERDD